MAESSRMEATKTSRWQRAVALLFHFTPLRAGCIAILVCAGLFHLVDRLAREKGESSAILSLIGSLDNRIMDIMFRARGPRPPYDFATARVVIVDIDERSLREVGQWPWPRTTLAKLVRNLAAASPKAIGFDVVFAEEDRSSPLKYVEPLRRYLTAPIDEKEAAALDNDLIFREALAEFPAVVLGYSFVAHCDKLRQAGDLEALPYREACYQHLHDELRGSVCSRIMYRAVVNNPKLKAALAPEGHFNIFPDHDGTTRKIPLLLEMDNDLYPALSLEMLRLGMVETLAKHEQPLRLELVDRFRTQWVPLRDEKGEWVSNAAGQSIFQAVARREARGIWLGDIFIPTDYRCELWLNHRGGFQTFPYISAVDILHSDQPDMRLRGKYILIGTSSAGLMDLRSIPFATLYPGVESHANAIDNILCGDFLRRDEDVEWWAIVLTIAIGGLLITLGTSGGGAVLGIIAGLLALAAASVGNYYLFFSRGYVVGTVYPVLSLATIFILVNAASYFTVGREKRFIREAFSVYLSPVVVSQLERHPEKARSLEGQQKTLSVMFSDIRDFTSIAEKMTPQQLTVFLNEYLTPMADIVMETGGTVDKFIGDAVMAFWGAPLDDPDHAINAALAVLRMTDVLAGMQPRWRSRGLPEIRIGVGLNTGLMSVGNMGSKQRLAYTVMGDNVNLASRLEGLNKSYGTTILITEATRQAIGPRFYTRCIDCVRVKGKQEPVRIYELIAEGEPPPERREEIAAFETAFTAYQNRRFAEAEALLRRLQEKQPHRLYAEYLARLAQFRSSPPPPDWDGVFAYTHK